MPFLHPNRRTLLGGLAVLLTLPRAALSQEQLNVVATTGMIADATRQVGGDRVRVRALMGPGIDPHAYRQTRSDIAATAGSDLVLWHGLYLEAQLEEFLADMTRSRAVVAVANTLPREVLIAHDDYADRFDPHVWMVPHIWALVVDAVRDALIAADPDGAETYTANAAVHQTEIAALAAYATQTLATVPAAARVLVTAHDAFNYFGNAYGFDVVGIQGISTNSEAGVQRITELVDMLVSRQIGAVFVESSVSDRAMRALIEGAGAQGHEVTIGGTLFSDAMGEDGSYEGTYVGMIDHNVTTITRALGGTVADRGMQGRLAA